LEIVDDHGRVRVEIKVFPENAVQRNTQRRCSWADADRILKRRMLDRLGTQQRILSSFCLDYKRFRDAPAYDFKEGPHPGPFPMNFGAGGSRAIDGGGKPQKPAWPEPWTTL